MVAPVPEDKVDKYSISDCEIAGFCAGDSVKINCIVENPALDEAPSNLAVVGSYVLSKKH